MEAGAMITLSGVEFRYGGPRAQGASFGLCIDALSFRAGEHAACIGPSGCGKTTLVNLIAGIVTPQAGRVEVDGAAVSAMGDGERRRFRAERIGMVFQEFELLDYLSSLENILLPFHLDSRRDRAAGRAKAEELAAKLGVSHVLRRPPRRLSQGERQRVAICRAMVTSPRVVLCDEPTGNLDPRATDAAMDLLLAGAAASGATLVMVTHNHAVLPRFDRVVDMAAAARSASAAGVGGEGA